MTPSDEAHRAKMHSMLLSPEQVQELVRTEQRVVSECLAPRDHKSWTPKLTVVYRDEEDNYAEQKMILMVLAVDFNEWHEKQAVLRSMGRKLYQEKKLCLAAMMSTEAWLSERPPGAPHVQPRDDPKRQEGIIIFTCAPGGEKSLEYQSFLRIGRDKKDFIIPRQWGEIMEGQSRLLRHFWDGFGGELIARMN